MTEAATAGGPTPELPDPAEALEALAEHTTPALIGIRHHSPVCAAHVPEMLERAQPSRLFVELPAELERWIPWLSHPELSTPVALASVSAGRGDLGFYPFADFSPELAAMRWALEHHVPVEAFDLPLASRGAIDEREHAPRGLVRALGERASVPDSEALWERLVEAHGIGSSAESVRRAGLLFGWIMRLDAGQVSERDLVRESYMRSRLAAAEESEAGAVALVGAFHAPALLSEPRLFSERPVPTPDAEAPAVTSLIAYADELLDSRSGYPAGIRDPRWQQRVYDALREGRSLQDEVAGVVVAVCRQVRAQRHVAGVPDASEAVRLALELARLRGLAAPSRGELLEALETALARGERLGRGRVLARALEPVMVGRRRGRLAPGTPRSGLVPHTIERLAELRLPGPEDATEDAKVLRLDPLRSRLDRERHVALARLRVAGVPYGEERVGRAAGDTETLGRVWTVRWVPATEAMLGLASARGVTLAQAAEGALRAEQRRYEAEDALSGERRIALLEGAAEAGLEHLASEHAAALGGPFLEEASLPQLLAAHALLGRLEAGHVPGLTLRNQARGPLLAAAVRQIDGLAGSDSMDDARALLTLGRLFVAGDAGDLGGMRLGWALDGLAADGSALMQGAAGALRVLLGREAPAYFGVRMGSWVTAAEAGALTDRLRGALVVAAPLFEADPTFCEGLLERVETIEDDVFLARLPALRGGFDALSPASRGRLLTALGERLDPDDARAQGLDVVLEEDPVALATFREADGAGRRALEEAGLLDAIDAAVRFEVGAAPGGPRSRSARAHAIGAHDRWRLVLGRERERMKPNAARAANAIEELYGAGRGEGAGAGLDGGAGGGKEESFPTVREWSEELEALFGARVREEVLGRAAAGGRAAAALALDPDHVTPSVELLEQILSLKGGLAEADLTRLRALVERIVSQLVEALARRLSPALTGLATPRPTRRPGGPLDLRRTVAANLETMRVIDGALRLVPERLVFSQRAKRSLDWHIVLVVDVSGSMEPSVIYSALMAAILSGMPALSVRFLAFSTEVIDLSERVDDPLGLLLEVKVGGGTHIAKALRYAREHIRVPARTIVLVVSDFEEGYPVAGLLAEVRAIAESGAHPLGLLALDDHGAPRYSVPIAERVAAAGMPVAALSPLELAAWVGERLRGAR